jgi:hypothetical protein
MAGWLPPSAGNEAFPALKKQKELNPSRLVTRLASYPHHLHSLHHDVDKNGTWHSDINSSRFPPLVVSKRDV